MTGRLDAALHGRRDACRYLALGPSIGGSVEMHPIIMDSGFAPSML